MPGRDAAAALAIVAAVAACGLAYTVPARHLDCADEPSQARCDAVARTSLSAMNLPAIGPIDRIVVTKVADCAAWGRSNFMSLELGSAAHCWDVQVLGDDSHGWTTVYQPVEGGPLLLLERQG